MEEVSNIDPCKKKACAIQSCLQRNDFQESKCQSYIDALYKCCEKLQKGESTVCEGIHNRGKRKKS